MSAQGDEVLACRHIYPGVGNAVNAICERFGVRQLEAMFEVPLAGEDAVTAAFDAQLGPATRLVLVDHVSSPLAAVMPVARIVDLCRRRGVPVLVDGAHAPGMLDLDLDTMGADWYTGNCHKWLYAPNSNPRSVGMAERTCSDPVLRTDRRCRRATLHA